MICPNCKKEIPDGTKFCTYCGAKVTEESAPAQEPTTHPAQATQRPAPQPAPAPQTQPAAPQQPAPEKNKKLNTVLIIVIVALLVIVAVVVTILVMSHSNKNQTAQVSETTTSVSQMQETQAQATRDSGSVQEPKNYVPAYTGYAYFSERSGRTWSRLRSAPRKNSTEVARIPDGAQVTVLSDQEYDSANNIYYVYVQYKGYHGWMRADFIE